MTPTQAPSKFHLFSSFPYEIRHAIWLLCLPGQRIADLDVPSREILPTLCRHDYAHLVNNAPPILALVCREAREIALKSGGHYGAPDGFDFLGHADPIPWFAGSSDPWMRAGVDGVYLNWTTDYSDYLETEGDALGFLLWATRFARATAVSIAAELVFSFRINWFEQDCIGVSFEVLETLASLRQYLVCIIIVPIHTSNRAAAISGLWGHLNDEKIKVVDPFDWDTVDRYRDFWETCGSEKDKEAGSFFNNKREDFQERTRQWIKNVEKMWVNRKWGVAYRDASQDLVRELDSVWLGEGGGYDDDFTWCVDITNRDLDKNHRMVQEWLRKMPEFKPVIQFRHCAEACHLTEERSEISLQLNGPDY